MSLVTCHNCGTPTPMGETVLVNFAGPVDERVYRCFTCHEKHATQILDLLTHDDDWSHPVNRAQATLVRALREDGMDDMAIYRIVGLISTESAKYRSK